MTPDQIIRVIEIYEQRFRESQLPALRMDTSRKLRSLNERELRMHAHYLCEEIRKLVDQPGKEGKVGRLLGFLQACLCFSGWYTIDQLRNHNRSGHLFKIGDIVKITGMTISDDPGRDYVHIGDTGIIKEIRDDGRVKIVCTDQTKWGYVFLLPGDMVFVDKASVVPSTI